MLLAELPIQGAERGPSRSAVGGQEAVEGIAGPRQGERLTHQGHERHLVDDEARVAAQGIDERRVVHGEPPHLGEELDLQQ